MQRATQLVTSPEVGPSETLATPEEVSSPTQRRRWRFSDIGAWLFQDYRVTYLRENVKIKEAKRFTFLRLGVAYMLSIAAKRIPHAAMNTEFDVTALLEYGKEKEHALHHSGAAMTNEILFRRAIHKNFSAFFVKAIAHALHHTPCMNAFLDYSPLRYGGTLYQAEDINIGVTVHTKYGVIRPVIRNAHQKTIEQVANELRDLSRRARRTDPEELYRGAVWEYMGPALRHLDFRALYPGFLMARDMLFTRRKAEAEADRVPAGQKLAVHEILGATCSLANIGMMIPGCQTVTVLAPPEVMMFGLGDMHMAPRVVNGEVVARCVISLCATMDHRAYDAGEAFPFGTFMKRYTSDPGLIYEWKPGNEI